MNVLCAFCGEPLNGKVVNDEQGDHHHQSCIDGYKQWWNDREKELRMRADTGIDPRVHVQIALELFDMQN